MQAECFKKCCELEARVGRAGRVSQVNDQPCPIRKSTTVSLPERGQSHLRRQIGEGLLERGVKLKALREIVMPGNWEQDGPPIVVGGRVRKDAANTGGIDVVPTG
jgi:hypothetical protein